MILIDGAHLSATLLGADRKDVLVVTFSGREPAPPARSGAAQEFFRKNGVACVHFIAKQNHWWQTEELEPALDIVANVAERQGYQSIVTYGSSMGGYGALIASGRLKAVRSVVDTPQFSVDPAKTGWDDRWLKDTRGLSFAEDRFDDRVGPGEIYVFSDPGFETDQRHVDMIAALRPVRHMRAAFAEHAVSRVLLEAGVLQTATLEALTGALSETRFKALLRAGRRTSPLIYAGASRALARNGKVKLADRFGARAVDLLMTAPPSAMRLEHERLLQQRAESLMADGRALDAVPILERWKPTDSDAKATHDRLHAAALHQAGDAAGALKRASALVRAGVADRESLNLLADCVKDADRKHAASAVREFRDVFLQAEGPTLRLIGALMGKNLDQDVLELCEAGAARFPARADKFNGVRAQLTRT
ncbi:hypothetical protein [Phenylobacterium immobile]|uniref:hypothetical protein n=1 Tax=Phenylobacterium immobile TaxID=21 RepID=UPI000B2F7068|nr:hypothetical protein [Phenylobacterium immobile]